MGKAITIRDIAKEAKVSPTTVSRYLNGTGYVDEQTASRICEVVERFHYRPNRIAQSLKTKETKNLVLVVPDIQNPFYSKMANEMQRFLFEEGYTVTLFDSGGEFSMEMKYLGIGTRLRRTASCLPLFPLTRPSCGSCSGRAFRW